ncbi:Uncharacterised protein [Atlantibacter hermannii]|nr:Uncharacterised protein [Atlantibacter hermannii]
MFLGFRWRGKCGECEGSGRFGQRGFLNFVELFCSPGWRGLFGFCGMVLFAWGSGALFVGWICSVRFRQRCASIATGERDRVGGARRRAPNTPGSPCHPRRFAVPSAYHVRLRVGRDTASCLSRPQAASLRLVPASREHLGEGDGVQHPRGTFRFSNVTEVSL